MRPLISTAPRNTVVATRGNFGADYGFFSDGVVTSRTYRRKTLITATCTGLQLLFANYNGETSNGANTITITASVDNGTTVRQVTFGGATSYALTANSEIKSDQLSGIYTAGDTLWIRTCVTVTSGQTWPLVNVNSLADGIEGYMTGDQTMIAVASWARDGVGEGPGGSFMFGPFAVIGRALRRNPCVALVGDSIMRWNQNSLFTQALGATFGENFSSFNFGKSGEYAQNFADTANIARRFPFLQYCTVAICDYGINDIYFGRSSAQIQTDLTTCWTYLVSRGLRVFQSTLLPFTGASGGQVTIRTTINDWIRAIPSPLTGYFETADIAETSRNSNVWRTGYAEDDLHPNSTGQAAIKAAISLDSLRSFGDPEAFLLEGGDYLLTEGSSHFLQEV